MLLFLYTLSILLMMFFPITLAIGLRRRVMVPWWLFCLGMVTFVGSQVVHFPLNKWLTDWGLMDPQATEGIVFWQTAVLLGFTAGLSEELARAVGYWFLFRDHRPPTADRLMKPSTVSGLPSAVMLGLGHGGIEAIAFGGVLTAASVTSLLALQSTDLNSLGLPPEQLELLQQQIEWFTASPLVAFTPLVERLIAMTVHVSLSVLVWLAFKRRNWLYIPLAILLHAAVDMMAVAIRPLNLNPWLIELLFALVVLPLALWLWRMWQKEAKSLQGGKSASDDSLTINHLQLTIDNSLLPHLQPKTAHPLTLSPFWMAVRKELQQQWRTKRVLVVTAVFLLFGLTSPMLAYFTPQLLKSIEGAEMFANLIPTPTAADAVAQYIKNLTQFGFILAVLLGMGLVAGEKEQGIAAMILSKPLPRWAFVLSKFVAQTAVYALAFLLAALGAYYYTYILFEPLNLGAFLFGNFLLLVWMLVFSAVTVLASTVASSTGAAAGMALGGSILLAILGSLPNIGALFPAGLVAWASGLGLETAVPANGGALAASLGLIVVCLVTAVAIFEVQEL